jgi:hypothetical protein
MNIGLVSFLANIPSIVCFGISGFLAYQGKEGWGWFLLIGLFVIKSVSYSKDKGLKVDLEDEDDDGDGPICPKATPASKIRNN